MTSFTFRPLSSWPGAHTRTRVPSPFKAGYQSTLDLLDRELGMLGARLVVLEVDVLEHSIRLDGGLRSDAKVRGPGVVISFDSRHGHLRYACDRFTHWQDNLRAIALGLESLRRVERYGIATRGEQYAGWKALPAAGGTLSRDQARDRLAAVLRGDSDYRDDRIDVLSDVALARKAMTRSHPDAGGDPDVFRNEILPAYQRLTEARPG